ncbi:MAG: MFS transporter [Ruminococcaceae bacterium]|nr:MFS transporter [Oscillospiraceae bacterium]
MITKTYRRLKQACYLTNVSMSVITNLAPILFITFRTLYGISYSLLGFLVLVNFVTQLGVDLVFSFFSHRFNIEKSVKFTPVLTAIGMIIYAAWPFFFPDSVYIGLIIGTILYSASSGLAEVLISPVISAIPSKDVDRELSKLHSAYAWGVVFVVIFCTLFFLLFGTKNWQWLVLMLTIVPICASLRYVGLSVPEIKTTDKSASAFRFLKNKDLLLCFVAIFLGGAADLTMAQWASSYLEQALRLPKAWSDIVGVAMFAMMMGLGRTLYGKYGKNIEKLLVLGSIGATLCYFITAVVNIPMVGLLGCALTGFCVSMLWPGSVVVASERFPQGGVFVFAIMAAGGDLGASVGPQLMGLIPDWASASPKIITLASSLNMAPEQMGMKFAMLVATVFPLLAVLAFYRIWKSKKKSM